MIFPRIVNTPTFCVKKVSYGLMGYNPNDMYVGRSLDLTGEYCHGEVELLSQLLKPGMCFMDIGANIGAITVPAAQMVGPEGHVLAVEVQPSAFNILAANVAMNGLFNVRLLNAAAAGPLADTSKPVGIPTLDPNQVQNLAAFAVDMWEGAKNVQLTPVPKIRISDLGMNHVDVIKLDIEGMELEVLQDLSAMILDKKPVIYTENNQEGKQAELIEHVESLEYRCYWHLPLLYRRDNFFGNEENPWGSPAICQNMLCLHESSTFDMSLFDRAIVEDGKCYAVGAYGKVFMPATAVRVA